MDSAIEIGRDKLAEKVDVETWPQFLETELLSVYNFADNDVKDATRRISSVKAKAKKDHEKAAEQAAGSDASSEPPEPEDPLTDVD